MSNLKRFLALTLVIVMVVSGMAMSVSAASFADIDAKTNPLLAYAADVLSELDVIKGVAEGKFGGEKSVTREQFALFTARIESASPELFVLSSPENAIKTKFNDTKDPTYWAAISYCSSTNKRIIEGRSETVFDPGNVVTFQEAVTMLSRALGYVDLYYPEGYLTKAKETAVALYGDDAPFTMSGVNPTDPLTRTQVLMLLYNYLMSNKYTIRVWYENGQTMSDYRLTPVLNNFGISTTEGYITGVVGWGISLEPQDVVFTAPQTALTGKSMSAVNPDDKFNNGKDLYISTITKDSNEKLVPGTPVDTTVADVGLDLWLEENDKAPLDLLGLKVKIFQDNRKNATNKINIPARIDGYKVAIDIAEASGALNGDGNAVETLSLPFPVAEFGEKATANKDNVDFNIYTFSDAIARKIEKKATDPYKEKPIMNFANSAKNKANYTLEFVFNGYRENGLPEFFYIYRPFSVGYYVGDDDGNVKFETALTGDGAKLPGDIKPATAKFVGEWADDTKLTIGEAYLYTLFGSHFEIYGQLSKTEKAVSNGNLNSSTKTAYFTIGEAAAKGVAFNGTWAIGAKSDLAGITKGATYSLFADASGNTLLARETASGVTDKWSNYVVVLSVVGSSTYTTAPNGKGYNGYSVNVYDPATNEKKDIFVTGVVPTQYDVLKYNVISGSVCEAFTITNNTSGKFVEAKETAGATVTRANFNVASSVATVGTLRGRLTSNTKIVLVSESNSNAVLSNVSELTDLYSKFDNFLFEEALLVTNDAGQALYVFVRTEDPYKASSKIGTYGTILSIDSNYKFYDGDQQYNLCNVAVYASGKYSKVTYAVKNGAVSVGDFVKVVGSITNPIDDTSYSTISLVNYTIPNPEYITPVVDPTIPEFITVDYKRYNDGNMTNPTVTANYLNNTIDEGNVAVYVGAVTYYKENTRIDITVSGINYSFGLDDIRYRSGVLYTVDVPAVVGPPAVAKIDAGYYPAAYDDNNFAEFKQENMNGSYRAVVYVNKDGVVISVTIIKVV